MKGKGLQYKGRGCCKTSFVQKVLNLLVFISLLCFVWIIALRFGSAHIRAKKVWWHTFRGTFNRPFEIALPDPASDHNTRVILQNVYEDALGETFRVALAGRCAANGPGVLDIGANVGIFSATAAAYGCDVLSVEVQARLIPYLAETARANGWTEGRSAAGHPVMRIRNVGVWDSPGELKVAVYDPTKSSHTIWLAAAMDDESIASCPNVPGCQIETVPVVESSTLVTGDLLLIKIDVDGPEATILRALLPSLRIHHVESIVVEFCPSNWPVTLERSSAVHIIHQLVTDPAFAYDLVLLNQVGFEFYKPGFLDRCDRVDGAWAPYAFIVPDSNIDELFEDGTAAINCKNILLTKSVQLVLDRLGGTSKKPMHS
jgi:FkbM family methyltransferase